MLHLPWMQFYFKRNLGAVMADRPPSVARRDCRVADCGLAVKYTLRGVAWKVKRLSRTRSHVSLTAFRNAPKKIQNWGDLKLLLRIAGQIFLPLPRSPAAASASSVGNGVELGAQLFVLGWDGARSLCAVCLFKPDPGPAPAQTCLFVDEKVH